MSARQQADSFWAVLFMVLLAMGGASAGVLSNTQAQSAVSLPMAPARQGDFLVIIRCRGDVKAGRSAQIYTPMVPNLRIAWLTPPGEKVQAGDTVVKFDSSSVAAATAAEGSTIEAAQATLDQALAQAKITAEQDTATSRTLNSTVERARLEASKQSIVSRIQGEESKIDLGLAEQKLKVQEATVALHLASDKSKIASVTRLREQAARRCGPHEIAHLSDGDQSSAPGHSGVFLRTLLLAGLDECQAVTKVGDNVFAGTSLAEMPDLDTLLMDAKVEEIDRGRIAVNNEVRVKVDSLPEVTMPAKIGQISLLAESTDDFRGTRSFRAYAPIRIPIPAFVPGMNGGMDIIINRIPNAISIPAKALFTPRWKAYCLCRQRWPLYGR